jgi:hypothetical protein
MINHSLRTPVEVTQGDCIIITSAVKTDVHRGIGSKMFMRVWRIFYPILRVLPRSLICIGKLWKNYLRRKIIPDEMRSNEQGRSK